MVRDRIYTYDYGRIHTGFRSLDGNPLARGVNFHFMSDDMIQLLHDMSNKTMVLEYALTKLEPHVAVGGEKSFAAVRAAVESVQSLLRKANRKT